MAAYPTLPTLMDSVPERDSGIVARRATNGALKMRADWPSDKTTFRLVYRLKPGDWATLLAFYQANKLSDVTYTWPGDGRSYTVRFANRPQERRGDGFFEVSVTLMEV